MGYLKYEGVFLLPTKKQPEHCYQRPHLHGVLAQVKLTSFYESIVSTDQLTMLLKKIEFLTTLVGSVLPRESI